MASIEVKAKNGTAKSARTLSASEKYDDIHRGIKLTDGNIGFNDNIYTFPYAGMCDAVCTDIGLYPCPPYAGYDTCKLSQ